MNGAYELFDHTADLGVRVRAPDLPTLVRQAAEGLYATLGRVKVRAGAAAEAATLEFTASEQAVLLRDFLDELLYRFERHSVRADGVEVEVFSDRRLRVRAAFAPVDAAASSFEREVKAVTYHELEVRQTEGGYEAVFIVDI
jgi:SHS2 domain-containing protein